MFTNYKRYRCRYPLYGGMQDWNYIHAGCFELTLEISDNKWPNAAEVSGTFDSELFSNFKIYIWQNNICFAIKNKFFNQVFLI